MQNNNDISKEQEKSESGDCGDEEEFGNDPEYEY